MNKYSLRDAIVFKAKESDSSLNEFLSKLSIYLKAIRKEKLLKETLDLFKRNKVNLSGSAKIISAKKLSSKDVDEIEGKHKEILKNRNVLYEIKEDLIGGYMLETVDQRIDATHKGKLISLYKEMIKE